MMWPFKKKPQRIPSEKEIKLDELMNRVREDIAANGGFCIIGLNGKENGQDAMSAAVLLEGMSKSKVVFVVGAALQMGPVEMLMSMERYQQSKVGFMSPIQKEDLKK